TLSSVLIIFGANPMASMTIILFISCVFLKYPDKYLVIIIRFFLGNSDPNMHYDSFWIFLFSRIRSMRSTSKAPETSSVGYLVRIVNPVGVLVPSHPKPQFYSPAQVCLMRKPREHSVAFLHSRWRAR